MTSRPAAIGEGWLDALGFAASELQPMSTDGCERSSSASGTQAMAAEVVTPTRGSDLARYEQSLLTAIDADRHLRALTVSPLLCALVCALNRERRTQLPARPDGDLRGGAGHAARAAGRGTRRRTGRKCP